MIGLSITFTFSAVDVFTQNNQSKKSAKNHFLTGIGS
jgi:hypothetical protein